MNALEEKLTRTLTDLGTTPDEIAAFLEGQGIVGEYGRPSACPLAIFLNRLFAEYHASVSPHRILLYSKSGTRRIKKPIATTDAVYAFVLRFDVGFYPHLTQPELHSL